ncbi:hypothetical protein FACS189434_06070 [Bacteroidia bacterium]|nr:hypothetical protein FACS189434_06070 [Bacteroidia bacterium]
MKKIILFTLIGVFVFLCTCSEKDEMPNNGNGQTEQSRGCISGNITVYNTGNRIDAQVQVLNKNKEEVGSPANINDFTFKLDTGIYYLKVFKNGYIDTILQDPVRILPLNGDCQMIDRQIEFIPPSLRIVDVNTKEVIFSLDFGGDNMEDRQFFMISNNSGNKYTWEIKNWIEYGWFVPSETTGELNPNENKIVSVKIDRNLLRKGLNTANLLIDSKGLKNGGWVLTVTAEKSALSEITTLNPLQSSITASSAILRGYIAYEGYPKYEKLWFEYSTSPDFTANLKTVNVENNDFTASIAGLTCGTQYYVRSYAKNSVGTVIGSETAPISFETPKAKIAISTTQELVQDNNLMASATIASEYTEKGFCWSLSPSRPSLERKIAVGGKSLGNFDAHIPCENLVEKRVYHVWAYAINACDTAYSENILLYPELPSFLFDNPNYPLNNPFCEEVGRNYAIVEDTFLHSGVPACTEKGFLCYDSQSNHIQTVRVEGYKSDGRTFRGTISNLQSGKTYKVKSYATNCLGTTYSKEIISFTTN